MSQLEIVESAWPWPGLESEIDPASTALLLIDLQHQAVDALTALNETSDLSLESVLSNCSRLLARFREREMRVVFLTSGPELPSQADLSLINRERSRQHEERYGSPLEAVKGTDRHRIIDEFAPRANEIVINKLSPNGFLSSHLDKILRNLEVETLVIAGLGTYSSVDSTARGASDSGYQCIVVEDATACEDAFMQRQVLRSYVTIFGRAQSTQGVIAEIEGDVVVAQQEAERVMTDLLTPKEIPLEQRTASRSDGELAIDLNWKRTGLLVVDMQYFCHPDFGMPAAMESVRAGYSNYKRQRFETVMPNCLRLVEAFRDAGKPVVFLTIGPELPDCSTPPLPMVRRNAQRANYSGRQVVFPAGTFEHSIMKEFETQPGEPIVNKLTASAFMTSKIDSVLRNMGIDSLVIIGVATNACVESTARDAADVGYRCVLVDDACVCYDGAFHEMTMRSFSRVFGRVAQTESVLQEILEPAI